MTTKFNLKYIFTVLLTFFVFTFTVTFTVTTAASPAKETKAKRVGHVLKLATLNIQWFGLGGTLTGSPALEKRDDTIREFIAKHILPADVVAFQEIVDPRRLETLFPSNWACTTYDHFNPVHQHVVMCTHNKYRFENVPYDDNKTIEQVALEPERSRPALRMNLVENKTNKILSTVVSVHLKAFPYRSTARLKQVKEMAIDLQQNDPSIPIIFMGDFNTYEKSKNNIDTHDIDAMLRIFKKYLKSVVHISHGDKFTYRKGTGVSSSNAGQLDQFFVRGALVTTKEPEVFEVCNNPKGGKEFFDIKYYNTFVSDHCPSKIEIKFTR